MNLYSKTDSAILLDIGAHIRETRIEQNITQKELETRSGVSARQISDIEGGKNCTILTLISLLRALSILDYLYKFFEEKQISPIQYAKLLEQNKKRKRASKSNSKDLLNDEEHLGW